MIVPNDVGRGVSLTLFLMMLAGMLHDLTSTYELTFHSAGAAVVVSGLLLCLARLARAARASHRVLKRVTSTETAAAAGSVDPI